MKLIMVEIKIVCKVGSCIHVFTCTNAKIAGKIRLSVPESETSFIIWNEIFIRRDLSILTMHLDCHTFFKYVNFVFIQGVPKKAEC